MTAILSSNNKKRDRLNMTSSSTTTSSSSSQSQQEEYEAALSFLRDFHSKQVSSGDMILHSLHSPSEQLDSIIESTADGNGGSCSVEDVLSSDFSLALSVGRSSESSLASSTHSSCDVSQPSHSPLQQRRGHKERRRIMLSTINLSPTLPSHQQPQTPITSNKRSRMKKCSTSECLLDLISNDTPTTSDKLPSFPTLSKRNEGIYNPSRLRCPPSPTRYEEGRDEQYSHYLDLGYAGQEQHVAKRHRM